MSSFTITGLFKALTFAGLSLALFPAQATFSPDAPTVLVTGANRGIGFELAKQYAEAGWNVIATTRRGEGDPGRAGLEQVQQGHPNLHIERIDVTSTEMINAVADKYRDQPLDVLINNAAAVEATFQADLEQVNQPYNEIDFDAARMDFDVNALGPMRMAQAFMDHVKRSKQKKIINVTSFIGSFGRGIPTAMGMNYGASKAALNMYSLKLSHAVKPDGVIVGLVEPILVASKPGVADNPMAKPVQDEVAKLRKVIADITMETSGLITNFSTGEIDPY
ncbi:MAG: SDR family NAD(P)-dependent oxidoreductase [Gammaproteobacteria bacterium]|nr:SDR family NAD(P)-dependent oxidoreductase [Gammaproteobacteria bacterium]